MTEHDMGSEDAWTRILSAVQRIESSVGKPELRQTAADNAADRARIAELEAALAAAESARQAASDQISGAASDTGSDTASAEYEALRAENTRLMQEVEQLRTALSSTDATGAELERMRMENDQLISGLTLAEERYKNAKAAASQIAARVDRAIGRLDDAMKE